MERLELSPLKKSFLTPIWSDYPDGNTVQHLNEQLSDDAVI